LAIADSLARQDDGPKYAQAAISHLQACALMNQLDNGLYQHSPLDPTAWGRGNGFAALGASICLSLLSSDIEGYKEAQQSFVRQIEALVKHQDATGSWHQVVDHPGSYPEFTSTCMIASAILLGIKSGVLQRDDYRHVIVQAKSATIRRIAPNGFINDVCTGTGKQKNLRAYLNREAVQGRNDRAGAMALLFLTLLNQ
jgi:rhamnogalacturonyl hydrolase YesR